MSSFISLAFPVLPFLFNFPAFHSSSLAQGVQLDLERTMQWCLLELESQTSHDINNDRTCLDLSSEIGYILLSILLLELDLLSLNFVLNP